MEPGKHDGEFFFGRITAGMTHELKNVLAIIHEAAGLMEDILATLPDDMKNRDRLESQINTIREQVRRGGDMTTHLNRFAHCADKYPASIDAAEWTSRMIHLSARFARNKGLKLVEEIAPVDSSVLSLETDPPMLLMLVFTAMDFYFTTLPAASSLHVRTDPIKDDKAAGVTISFTPSGGKPQLEGASAGGVKDNLASMEHMATVLGGTLSYVDDPGEIRLALPPRIPG